MAASRAGYRLNHLLGEGSFKVCFAATAEDGTDVAFKVLKPHTEIVRTQRELAAMHKCDHPNIARCLDSGAVTVNAARIDYVVEERFEAGSLRDQLVAGLLSRAVVIDIGTQLIDAIAHIRKHDLVHRDIKPDNIMFSRDGRPVLTDFGIVRALTETSLTATASPYGLGTPSYMPAEQFFNRKQMINWRADQFALGVTLGVAGLGLHPFGDTLRRQVDTISQNERPSGEFVTAARERGLPVLIRMVQPYPVQRYAEPSLLKEDWIAQKP